MALYVVFVAALLAGEGTAWQAAEARQIADRLGLSPAGLVMNGWRLAESTPATVTQFPRLA